MSDDRPIWQQVFWPETPAPRTNGTNGTPPTRRPGEATAYADAALRGETAAIAATQPGSRNDRLNVGAFNLGQLVAAGHLDTETVTRELHDAATLCGLPPHEIEATTASGLRAGMQHAREVTADARDFGVVVPGGTVFDPILTPAPDGTDDDDDDDRHPVERLFPRLDWHALWASEDDEDDWVIEPLIPARRLVALYSPPKLGKSLLMLELAVAISRGGHALGRDLDRPRRVLYVDLENDPRGDIRTRLQQMGHGPDDLTGLVYLSFPSLAGLDTPHGANDLIQTVDHYQCEVVIIDTISRLVAGEENDNDTWLNFYRHTGANLKARGVAVVRLDHTGKDLAKGMRGGSAKYGDVDLVWSLTGPSPNMIQLELTAQRQPLAETLLVLERVADPWLHHRVRPEGRLAAYDAEIVDAVTFLDQIVGVDVPVGVKRAQAILTEHGRGRRHDKVRKIITARNQAWNQTAQIPWPIPSNEGSDGESDDD